MRSMKSDSEHPSRQDAEAAGGASPAAPKGARPGEELDLPRLTAYLSRQEGPAGIAPGETITVEQFPGGYSNLTYLLRVTKAGGEPSPEARDREMVLRRPPFGNRVASAHDMAREHRVLAALHPLFPLAPEPYLLCEDEAVLGAPFYVMERRRGLVPHRAVAASLNLDEARARKLSEAFIDRMARLHSLDLEATGLGELGRPEGYGRRQVEGWSERYRRAATDDHGAVDEVTAWLAAELPRTEEAEESSTGTGSGPALVHNDYKYDNLVLDPADPARIVGILDWEMATVGDPLYDLGTTLAYWVNAEEATPLAAAGVVAPAFPGSLDRRGLAERYAEATGRDVSGLLFHYVFGLFKVAVIAQQIYARYRAGHTRDPRFARLGEVVGLLGRTAAGAVEKETF